MSYNDGFCFLRDGTRSETFWHDQGNAIIVTGQSRFRLYPGMLATRNDTQVFHKIRTKAKPYKEGDGAPVVVVHTDDAPLDMYHFLRAFYDGLKKSITKANEPDFFDALAGILRLSVKYEVGEFEHFVVNELSSYYPRKLRLYAHRRVPQSPKFHIEALNLVTETGVHQFIDPITCIISTSLKPTQVLSGIDGVRINSSSVRLRCLTNMRLAAVLLSVGMIKASYLHLNCTQCQDGLKLLQTVISSMSPQNPIHHLDVLGTLSLHQRASRECPANEQRYNEGVALWRTMLSDTSWAGLVRGIVANMAHGVLFTPMRGLWWVISHLSSVTLGCITTGKEAFPAEIVRYCRTAQGKKVSFYAEDGDLAIGVEHTVFSVYAGVLKSKSSIFRYMFEGSSAPVQILYDGKPYMELEQERAIDVYYFLMAIHRPNDFFQSKQSRTFEAISGMLRQSMKYDVPDLRQAMVEEINKHYPTSLAAFQLRDESFDTIGRPFQLIKLALQPGSPIYPNLPSILYVCYSKYNIQENYDALQILQLLESPLGRNHMEAITYTLPLRQIHAAGLALKRCAACTSSTCSFRRSSIPVKLDTRFGLRFRLPLGPTSFFYQCGNVLCDPCKSATTEVLNKKAISLWEDLPRYFLGSSWDRMV